MRKIIHSQQSGHTLHVAQVPRDRLPKKALEAEDYTTFYEVRNWDAKGVVFMWLGKGYSKSNSPTARNEIVAWYRNGQFWSSFGTTLQSAIEGAQKDGWMYTADREAK